ncbi:ABC transporter permease [Klugiella xanthotipulae]|nr:ABC transporter permease [Klugiella xanthotipulae]
MTAQDRFDALSHEPLQSVGGGTNKIQFFASVRDIFDNRALLDLLIRRDLKAKYKDSALGFLWTLIKPLTQLLIYWLILGKVLQAERNIPEFAIYIFAGLTAYGLFSEILSSGTSSIVSSSGLIKKVYLPREIFPLAAIGSALFNFVVQFAILVAATILIGSFPLSWRILYIIPAVLLLVILGLGLSLLLSAINVYLRDIKYLVEVATMVLMWASPIVYSWSMVHRILGDGIGMALYTNNPITLAVLGFHKAMWTGGGEPTAQEYPDNLMLSLWVAIGISTLITLVSHAVFRKLQGNFAQML